MLTGDMAINRQADSGNVGDGLIAAMTRADNRFKLAG